MGAALTACALMMALSGSARAQGDTAAAEALFMEGQRLFDEGKTAEACAKLEASLKLDRAIGTLLNTARCHAKLGKNASAWGEYREAAERAQKLDQHERADGARKEAAALEPTLSRLTIQAAATPKGFDVARDGVHLDVGALGVAVPIDPGRHEIIATAPGFDPWKGTVDVAAGGAKAEITIPALLPAKNVEAAPGSESGGGVRIAGIVVGSVGVATAIVGGVLGGLTLSTVSNAEEDESLCGPDKLCTPAGLEEIDSARTTGIVSTILLAVGGAAATGGLIMIIVGGPTEGTEAAWTVTPWAAPEGGGAAVGFRF